MKATEPIKKYDNFLITDQCSKLHHFILNSLYRIGWEDSAELQHRAYPNIYSSWSKEDVNKIKILEPVLEKINLTEKQYDKCIINLVKPLDVNFIHVHPDQVVALYYANLTWNPEWAGETIFYEQDKKTIKLANPYTPNQLVVFDGSTPHTIKSQNILAPSYRFTISLFFNK